MTDYPEYLAEYAEVTATRQEIEMTKSTTKKTTTSPKKADTPKAPEPMDSRITEAKVGTPSSNNERVCYAAKTLVAEAHELFPETPVEYSNPDGRNTMLDVSFDLTALDTNEADELTALLELVKTDARVADVLVDDDTVLISFKASARTQDSRDSFGLADAWYVLTEGDLDRPSVSTGGFGGGTGFGELL